MINGREYLLDYANDKSDWLKTLIHEAIESNGDISEEKLNCILEVLLYDKKIDICDCSSESTETPEEIKLTKLIHKQGVNALANNQTIKFCDNVNILFGMNGTGKSSYFRILNEIVGGNQKKEILSNINFDEPAKIEVDIDYSCNGAIKSIEGWDSSSRSLRKLNKCMVYDTSYQNGLLGTRESNETLVEPLGLHLFGYIIDTLDNMKKEIDYKVEGMDKDKPYISTKDFDEPIKNIFVSGEYSDDIRNDIEEKCKFTEVDVEEIKSIEDDIKFLKQNNLKDKIELLNNEGISIQLLIEQIEAMSAKLEGTISLAGELIIGYNIKKDETQKSQERYQALKDIPKSETQEWKTFIESGNKYSEKSEAKDESICLYCRQGLETEESIQIVKTYSLFLKDSTQVELNDIIERIVNFVKEVQDMIVEISFQENINEILRTHNMGEETISERIRFITNSYMTTKEIILNSLETYRFEEIKIEDTSNIIGELKTIAGIIINKSNTYSKEEGERTIRLNELEIIEKTLKEKKSVYIQRQEITKWFEISEEINRILRRKAEINSRTLSLVSKKAHEELLTESLKVKFAEELKKAGLSNLEVKLQSKGIRKGISRTELVIKSLDDVRMILSEGEQRAVALSLFIAEIRLQNNMNPIILDDPVNSLDHKIAGNFAERLLELDNQIIIFIHNQLFLDSFESIKTNHVCKTIDSACNNNNGKHIRIYEVISQGINNKGVLREYKGSKLKDNIREIERVLSKQPFEDDLKAASFIRLAVETAIDEIVFNHQVPTKFSNKNSRIQWDALKGLNTSNKLIDRLKSIHGRVSGGSMHNGIERSQNPIEFEEYEGMLNEIKSIQAGKID